MRRRYLMTIVGLLLLGLGMGMLKSANLGIDPYSGFATELTVFMEKILHIQGASYSIVYSGLTALLFIWVFFADKHFIHLGTIIHIVLAGKITDYTQHTLNRIFVPDTLWKQLLMLLGAFIVFCFASAIYYAADLGVSAYDAVSLYMAKKKIMEYRYARILTDVVCLVLGSMLGIWATGVSGILGAQLGIGTLLTAFGMGPFVQFLRGRFFDPMVEQQD